MLEKIDIIEHARRQEKIKPITNIIIGIIFSLTLFAATFALYLDFTYMGARNEEMETLIFDNFKLLLTLINIKILIIYILIGFIIGGFSWLLQIKKKQYIILFNFFFWFIYWVHSIKYYPQMFIDQLYRRGDILKYFQIFVTDVLPMAAIYLFFAAIIISLAIVKKRILSGLAILVICAASVIKFDVAPAPVREEHTHMTPPNVLVIATDSLRPRNISYNGYYRKTPNIDSLFSKGINFLDTKASMARTLPSWTSILTSLYPPDHEIRHMFPPLKDLKKKWVTLIDVLNHHNYYTAIISDFAGDRFPSIDYGFKEVIAAKLSIQNILKQRCQEFHYFLLGFILNPLGRELFPEMDGMSLNKDPWYVTHGAKKSIKKAVKQKKPFFVLYFSSNNHFPYVTKYPYYQTYIPKDYKGRHKYGLSFEVMGSFLKEELKEEEVKYVIDHYDNATHLFDDNVGELLTYLKDSQLEKNTIVIVMSDHGENLYEKNYGLAHGDHLLGNYANNMVFGIYSPFEDFKGRRIDRTVRDIDIAPTILDLLKYEIPKSFRGHSLVPVIRGADFDGYPAYMETGVWYTPDIPYIKDRIRIPYPNVLQMIDAEMPEGNLFIKEIFRNSIIAGKYKAYHLNNKKYIYMPGETLYKEEYYIDEQSVIPSQDQFSEFFSFKQSMVDMFKGKFFIDNDGFIHENSIYSGKKSDQ